MLRIKGPGLFIRISHLILIQIVFVFTALGLVIFNSADDNSVAQYYQDLGKRINAASAGFLASINSEEFDSQTDTTINQKAHTFLREHALSGELDLLYHDALTGNDSLIHLGASSGDNNHFSDIDSRSAGAFYDLLKTSDKPFIVTFSQDDRYLNFIMQPNINNPDRTLVVTIPNELSRSVKNHQAELLFILFLISALISLLIINLIFRGIKRPLARVTDAFEKTAEGEEHYINEPAGDRELQRLIDAFNRMSQILSEKQRKLSAANRDMLRANKSLLESESILTALVDYSPEAIIVTDLDDQIIIYNQQAAQDLGYNQTEMLGKKIGNLMTMPNTRHSLDDTITITPEEQEIICRRRDGSRYPALLVHTSLGPDGRSPIAMLYFIKNISESQNYQNMILKLDRVASRGKMARDIAHEINNYLAVLQGNLELIPMILAKGDTAKVEQKLNVMKDTVSKISNFTDGLTQFSDESTEFRKEDLNQLIENLVAFVKPQNKFDEVLIGTNLAENMPLVEIDAGQMQLLLVNLIYNAAEALEQFDGTRWIIISTSLDDAGESFYLKVSDSGPGVRSEDVQKLFVNRFSTKRKANGLGLITCKNVVDSHRGEISYHSGDESMAIFVIRIPVKHFVEKAEPSVGAPAIAK